MIYRQAHDVTDKQGVCTFLIGNNSDFPHRIGFYSSLRALGAGTDTGQGLWLSSKRHSAESEADITESAFQARVLRTISCLTAMSGRVPSAQFQSPDYAPNAEPSPGCKICPRSKREPKDQAMFMLHLSVSLDVPEMRKARCLLGGKRICSPEEAPSFDSLAAKVL